MKYIYLALLICLSHHLYAQICPGITNTVSHVTCYGDSNGAVDITIAEPNITFDGSIAEAAWGTALATNAGGSAPGFGAGHELAALHLNAAINKLFIGLAGNVQDQNRILIFVDCKSGGYNNGGFDRSGASFGLTSGAFNSGITFDPGFFPDYCVTIGTNVAGNNYYVDIFPLLAAAANNTFYGDNTHPLIECAPANSSSTAGFELAIPWDSLGGRPQQPIKAFAIYQSDNGFMSNQFLSAAGNTETNYGNNPVDFTLAAPNPVQIAPMLTTWSTGDSTVDLAGLAGGIYTLSVSNGVGCSTSVSYTITEAIAPVSLSAALVSSIICFGDSATISTTTTGGTLPYAGTTTGTATLAAGGYTLTTTDSNGCTASDTISIAGTTLIKPSILPGTLICAGDSTIVSVAASGGKLPYTGVGTYTVGAGPYSFTITDSLGCSDTLSGIISSPAPLIVSAAGNVGSICEGSTVTLSAAGASTYTWQPAGVQLQSYTDVPTSTTNYIVTGTDTNGCVATDTVNIIVNPLSGKLMQATTSNAASVPGTQCTQANHTQGLAITYTNSNCDMCCSITDAAGGTELAMTDVCTNVLLTAPVNMLQTYAKRTISIAPLVDGPSTITLYYTDEDFAVYNSLKNANVDSLPTNAAGYTSGAAAITQTDGSFTSGTTIVHTGLTALWNSATSLWAVTLPVANTAATYYLHTYNAALSAQAIILTGITHPQNVHLQWHTSGISSFSHYSIISNSGTQRDTLATVPSIGADNQGYTTTVPRQNTQYSVVGHSTGVVSVTSNSWQYTQQAALTLAAMPSQTYLLVQYTSLIPQTLNLQLCDINGRVVHSTQVRSESSTSTYHLQVAHLCSGVYVLTARNKWGAVQGVVKCAW